MDLDDSSFINNTISKEPSENHIIYITTHLSTITKNPASDFNIQKAISLASNSTSASRKNRKKKEKKKEKAKWKA